MAQCLRAPAADHPLVQCGPLLQGIEGPVNYVVTLNPPRPIAKERIIYETVYHHPLYTAASVETHALLPQIQDRGGVVWAGAWCGGPPTR